MLQRKEKSEALLADMLRKRGLKVTSLRVAVLGILRRNADPVGAPEIFEQAKSSGANYVTVYRTIKSLEEAGIIRRVNLRHNHADYELAEGDDHHHLVCVSCDRIEEFDGCGIDALAKKVLGKSRAFASISDHALEFFGTCSSCIKT